MRRGVTIAFIAFAAGLAWPRAPAAVADERALYRALDRFVEVFDGIRRHYIEPPPPAALVDRAIRGMVRSLDDWSEFLSPDEVARVQEEMRGRYSGIGAEVATRGGRIVVVAAFDDAPAAIAGLRSGDVILAIGERDLRGASVGEAVRLLRGAAGTVVQVRVARGAAPAFTVSIERARLRVVPVSARPLGGGLGYVQVRLFHRGTVDSVRQAVERLPGADGRLKGLVLDLRQNPGGLFDQAAAVSNLFLQGGEIVRTHGRAAESTATWYADDETPFPNVPIAVLVDGGTASASEIVAGALRDRGRALLIGERTFGKGTVQSLLRLSDGAGVKLTIARYVTPSGTPIDGRGLVPDIAVDSEGDGDAVLDRAATALRERE